MKETNKILDDYIINTILDNYIRDQAILMDKYVSMLECCETNNDGEYLFTARQLKDIYFSLGEEIERWKARK